jgi:putative MFS transporter
MVQTSRADERIQEADSMTEKASLFSSRSHAVAFWTGCLAVTAGVLLHMPMFLMGLQTHFVLAGMPMGTPMLIGMGLIVAGFAATAYGLMPRRKGTVTYEEIAPPEDAPLTKAHWIQILVLIVALVIDVMKAASLGFVIPGMRVEYHLSFAAVEVLPFSGLLGTTIGSFLWGTLSDFYGRRASILLAAVVFMGTSICGAMPAFSWNIAMCFMMGIGAGGMLPVAYALMAEIMPTRHRGWCLVLVGGIGTVGGYFATSTLSALLQPFFGWRIMWLIGLPTALVLIVVSPVLQESARFLQAMGRTEEARETLARFGIALKKREGGAETTDAEKTPLSLIQPGATPVKIREVLWVTAALTLASVAWGFVNFGVLLWLPGSLVAEGRSMGVASQIIARSALIAMPTILAAAWLYSVWSTKKTLLLSIGITTLGLAAVMLRDNDAVPFLRNPVIAVSLLVIGTSAVISILLPYAAECYPVRVRGRATGWVAGFSKAGGVTAQVLGMLALVPALGAASGIVAIPSILSILMIALLGRDTKGRDLRELEARKSGGILAAE